MKVKGFTLVEAIITIVILAIIAAVLFPFFARPRENVHRPTCASNLKQIGLGLMQYIQDYDEQYPPTRNASGGWAELIYPYVKSDQIFHCPAAKSGASKTTDYFFNARLSGVAAKDIAAPNLTLAMGDGLVNQSLDTSITQLPASWRDDSKSPAHRHLQSAYYAFADGHVKALKPAQVTTEKPSKLQPTFLVK